jgi:hypothetical protein
VEPNPNKLPKPSTLNPKPNPNKLTINLNLQCAQANVFEARREEEAAWRECFECSGQDGACAGAGGGAGLVDVESLAHGRPKRGLAGMCVNFHCNYRYERARAGNRAAVLEAEFELLMGDDGPDRL